MLGVQAGTAATEAQVRAVFGRLEHPTRVDAKTGEPLSLGSRPRTFQSRDERVARALAAEPDATEERRAEIRNEVYAQTRKAVAYYDLTFSPVKSVSVYWTALLEAGRDAEAADVVAAHRAGVAAAMAYVEQQAAYVRSGYHGKTTLGAVGRGVRAGPRAGVDPLGPLDQPRPAAAAAQPRHGAQPGRDHLRRGDPGAGQPRLHTDQAGRRGDLHQGLPRDARRLQRGGVRDPPGRQGARDRRVHLAAAGQGVLPDGGHHGAAGRARRAVPSRPTGGTRPRSRPGGSTAPRGGRPARRRTTRWRRAGSWRPGRRRCAASWPRR